MPRRADPRTQIGHIDELTAGLDLAIEGIEEELRAHRAAAVLHLPLPAAAGDEVDEDGEQLPETVGEAIAPLLSELARLRAEVAALRRAEEPAAVARPELGTGLFRLVAAIIVCFILIAVAVVIVVKA